MIETFTALLLAHVLADFVLQPGWMAGAKRRAGPLLLHGAVVLVAAQATLGTVTALPVLMLALAHVVIDAAKARLAPRPTATAFLADQAAHLATLLAVTLWQPDLLATGLWTEQGALPGLMALVAGAVVATRAGGFAIGLLMEPWSAAAPPGGLPGAGRTIGLLERGLIFVLILAGQPAGIGFLIAAKSILRFEATTAEKPTGEYVIIGTLASFGWGIVTGYITLALMQALPPLGILPATP